MLDFDAHQVEENLAEDAVLEVELGAVELELDVEALFYSDLHLDRFVFGRFGSRVGDNELLLLGDPVIIAVDHHVDVVPQPDYDSIVAFELFLDPVELEIVLNIVCKLPGWLQVSDNLKERAILVLIIEIFNDPDKLDPDAEVVNPFVLVESDGHLSLDVFSVLKSGVTQGWSVLTMNTGAL